MCRKEKVIVSFIAFFVALLPALLILSASSGIALADNRDLTLEVPQCTPTPSPAPFPTVTPSCCTPGDKRFRYNSNSVTGFYLSSGDKFCCKYSADTFESTCVGSGSCGTWGPWVPSDRDARFDRCYDFHDTGKKVIFRGKCVEDETGKRYIRRCEAKFPSDIHSWCLSGQNSYDCGPWEKTDDPSCKACKPIPGTDKIFCLQPECPPGWTLVRREIVGDVMRAYCRSGCPDDAECTPGDSRMCGNGGRQTCTTQCKWGPCTSPPECLSPPACSVGNCSVNCTWESLQVNASAECGIVTRRPYPYALVGVPLQMQLMCDSVTGEVSDIFRGATMERPPYGAEDPACGTRPEPYEDMLETCDKQWIYKLYASYELSCTPSGATWNMDEYPANVGKRSSDIVSPYEASDEAGRAISKRRVSEIMRELYPDDPLLIRDIRSGGIVRHIYERSSAGKTTIGPNNMPSYNVQVNIPWRYIVRFSYTRRVPRNCETIQECGGRATRNECICAPEYSVDCISDDNCRCKKRAYQGADESPNRIPYAILVGTFFCDKAEDELFPTQCRGVPIPVMEVQSIVR